MSRRIEGDDGKKSALNMRTTHALRSRIEEAAAKSGRSMAQEAEFRLERSFDPVAERLCEIALDKKKSALVIRALVAIFDRVSFEDEGVSSYIARAGLLSAFAAILEEHFPQPSGLMADIFHHEDPELKARAEKRFRLFAEDILKAQRIALYGEGEKDAGLTLLQTAQVLGLIPTEGPAAAKLLDAASRVAKSRKSATAG